jgi:hypothetical protein
MLIKYNSNELITTLLDLAGFMEYFKHRIPVVEEIASLE